MKNPSDALQGKAPDAIDPVAEFDLQKINAAKAAVAEKKQVDHKAKIAASGTVRPLIDSKEGAETRLGLGPRRRKFIPTYSGKLSRPREMTKAKSSSSQERVKTHTAP